MFQEFKTSLGIVRGAVADNVTHISRFRYAKSPIGILRFAKPVPPECWSGVFDATGPTAMAPQYPSRLAAVMGDYPVEQSEDCLHLDIWIPRSDLTRMPVFVFFHGGAFVSGGGGMPCYDGSVLAARGSMIVVNVSSRLGALGLLPITDIVPANLTLHDQIAALRFIQDEIESFGGDRKKITVAGQSAGALSIALLLGRPEFAGLFNQAIMLSAPLASVLQTSEQAMESVSKPMLQALGVHPRDRDALCATPVARILEVQQGYMRALAAKMPPDALSLPFQPTIDGEVVYAQPAASKMWFQRPIIMGTTRHEFGAFWFGRSDLPPLADGLLHDRLQSEFPDDEGRSFRTERRGASPLAMLGDLSTRSTFLKPMLEVLDRIAAKNRRCYAYQFDWYPSGSVVGACHCIELPFLFGNLKTWKPSLMLAGAREEELIELRGAFQDAVMAFVHFGNPSIGIGSEWPQYGDDRLRLHFPTMRSSHDTAERDG